MLHEITPVILTYYEEPNTRQFPKVRIFQRSFNNRFGQCDYAIRDTGISFLLGTFASLA